MVRSEYTRLRDIAQKRLGRLEAAGLAMPGLSFPKLRELKTEAERASALIELRRFVEAPTQVKQVRPTGNIVAKTPAGIVVDDPQRIARNERRRQQRAARKEALAALTKNQRSMIKGAKTLGIRVSTKDIPTFVSYMEYRFSQYSDSRFYLFADYAEDFSEVKKRLKEMRDAAQIEDDFIRFKQEYEQLHEPVDATGYSAAEFQKMWDAYIDKINKK